MKSILNRNNALLLMLALGTLLAAGCQSWTSSGKTGDEMNNAMSPQQKALISEHKKNSEQ